MVFENKHAFFGKWTLNLGKILEQKRHIQDGSSEFLHPKNCFSYSSQMLQSIL